VWNFWIVIHCYYLHKAIMFLSFDGLLQDYR
jgi:hypothetical protein